MNLLFVLAAAALLGMLAVQAVLMVGFARMLFRRSAAPADADCPKAAVVLCLRGADPFLSDCVRGLLRQNYPRYDVRIVVDSDDDPARAVVEEVVAESAGAPPVQVRPLMTRRETCSLKCSSLLQAAAELDESYEVLALLDADTIPHANWLRELVAPLTDARCGAVTGIRWYMPDAPSCGAHVRYLWNVGAVVMMYWMGIAWGGSLALRARLLRQTDLPERWGRAFCEDTMTRDVLRRQGLRLAFAPSVLMVNREDCDLPGCFRWMKRQLLCSRLHYSRWPEAVLQCAATTAALAFGLGLFAAALLLGRWADAAWVGGALAVYQTGMAAFAAVAETGARRVAHARGEPTDWLTFRSALLWLAAIPLTQVVYAAAMTATLLARRVVWRGVSYEVKGPWMIRLLEYRPFRGSGSAAAGRQSL